MTKTAARTLTDAELATALEDAFTVLADPAAHTEAMLRGINPRDLALSLAFEKARRRNVPQRLG